MNERIEQIEIKVAFLEQANAQLSDELFHQRQKVEAIQAQLNALTGRFEAAQTPLTAFSPDDEKPPHY